MTKPNHKKIIVDAESAQPGGDSPADTDGRGSESETTAAPEYGGPKGKDPTRYGDWERNGRCIDF